VNVKNIIKLLTVLLMFLFNVGLVNAYEDPITDIRVLLDSANNDSYVTRMQKMFEDLSGYHGLKYSNIDLGTTELTDSLLKDESGNYLNGVYIHIDTLESRLSSTEISILNNAVEAGLKLLIVGATDTTNYSNVAELTSGAITGASLIGNPEKQKHVVTAEANEITKEFAGQSYDYSGGVAWLYMKDGGLNITGGGNVDVLVNMQTPSGSVPVFARYKRGAGDILVLGFEFYGYDTRSLDFFYFGDYSNYDKFMTAIPMMMFLKYAGAEEVWHNDHNYANFQIDDPSLREPAELSSGGRYFSYYELLPEMEQHQFHTTIGTIPQRLMVLNPSQPEVVNLFLANPSRYSITMHGTTHIGPNYQEFCEYGMYPGTDYECRTYECQDELIRQGVEWMDLHEAQTGIISEKLFIPPGSGIQNILTFGLLKKHNLQGAIRRPLEASKPNDIDFAMLPSDMNWESFPSIKRLSVSGSKDRPSENPYTREFDSFIDIPILLYSHANYFYDTTRYPGTHQAFNPIADDINNINGGIEWKGIGYILEHLYWEKVTDDGNIEVWMFSNGKLEIVNSGVTDRTYYVKKVETLNVPITSVTVDGIDMNYTVNSGFLNIEPITIPAGFSKTVHILYESASNQTIDVTPPADMAEIRDGIGVDVDSTMSKVELSANWDASSDPESGILRYWYSIGTAPGTTSFIGWTDNGINTSVSVTGLLLALNQTYYFNVKAENVAGLFSNVTSSDGILVEQYNPPPGSISGVVCEGSFCHLDFTDLSLIAYYPFDDGGDSINVYNWVNGAPEGELVGSAAIDNTGIRGKSFSGTGNKTAVKIGKEADYGTVCDNGCTFTSWVYTENGTGDRSIIAKMDYWPNNRFFNVHSPFNYAFFQFDLFQGGNTSAYCGGIIGNGAVTGKWMFVAGVYDGSSIRVYMGDTSGNISSTSKSCTISIDKNAWQNSPEDAFIGAMDDGNIERAWDGKIDEVMIFNRGLSEYEINRLYNFQQPRFLPDGSVTLFRPITPGNNRAGISVNTANQDNASIMISINDGSGWTDYKVMDDGIPQEFSILPTAQELNLSFLLLADAYYAWSPVLYPDDIVIEVRNTDTIYPVFSGLMENPTSGSYYMAGASYEFRVNVASTNGVVVFTFDGSDYPALNVGGDTYSVVLQDMQPGTYNYFWTSYGNGTSQNMGISETKSFTLIDGVYPVFSELVVNPVSSSDYVAGASYEFRVNVTSTNGVVTLTFEGADYTALNIGGDTYSVTLDDIQPGIYNYYWKSYADGPKNNEGVSNTMQYIVIDGVYPSFSGETVRPVSNTPYSNSADYLFSIDVSSTNGVVVLTYNGIDYIAAKISGDTYGVMFSDIQPGTYDYYWTAYGSGPDNNIQISQRVSYVVADPIPPVAYSEGGQVGITETDYSTLNSLFYTPANCKFEKFIINGNSESWGNVDLQFYSWNIPIVCNSNEECMLIILTCN